MAKLEYNLVMPNPFEQIHIIYAVIFAIIIATNAFYAFSGVFRIKKKRCLAVEIIFFTANALLYVGASFMRDQEVLEIVKIVPYLGEFFVAIEQYLLFLIAYVASFAFICFNLIVQAIKWSVLWAIKGKKAPKQAQEELPRVVKVESLDGDRTRVLNGKTYIKSDFTAEYQSYLRQKDNQNN